MGCRMRLEDAVHALQGKVPLFNGLWVQGKMSVF